MIGYPIKNGKPGKGKRIRTNPQKGPMSVSAKIRKLRVTPRKPDRKKDV